MMHFNYFGRLQYYRAFFPRFLAPHLGFAENCHKHFCLSIIYIACEKSGSDLEKKKRERKKKIPLKLDGN